MNKKFCLCFFLPFILIGCANNNQDLPPIELEEMENVFIHTDLQDTYTDLDLGQYRAISIGGTYENSKPIYTTFNWKNNSNEITNYSFY